MQQPSYLCVDEVVGISHSHIQAAISQHHVYSDTQGPLSQPDSPAFVAGTADNTELMDTNATELHVPCIR